MYGTGTCVGYPLPGDATGGNAEVRLPEGQHQMGYQTCWATDPQRLCHMSFLAFFKHAQRGINYFEEYPHGCPKLVDRSMEFQFTAIGES